MSDVELRLKKVLKDYFREKKINPPITRSKLIKSGYNPTEFLTELEEKVKEFDSLPIVKNFLEACKDLL